MPQELFTRQRAMESRRAVRCDSAPSASVTFAQAASVYRGERRFLRRLVAHLGDTLVTEITQDVIDRTIDALYPNAARSTQVRQAVTPISAVLHNAAARGLCEYRQIKRPRQPKPDRLRWISPSEAACLVEACSDHFRPILLLMLTTTCHPSEAIFLNWCQVDLARRAIHFPAGKIFDDRVVPLHPALMEALERLPHRKGAVFRRPDGQPYSSGRGAAAVKTAFTAACRRAKITDFTIRDARVTSAVWELARNRDIDALMVRGGWRGDPRTAARYKRISVADLDALRTALDEMQL